MELCDTSHEQQMAEAQIHDSSETQLTLPDPNLASAVECELQSADPVQDPKKGLRRNMSRLSLQAMCTLDGLSERLTVHEARVDEIICRRDGCDTSAGKIKGELGQQFGNVDKLLSNEVDAVSTAELNSGKHEVRASRKAITLRAQTCLDRIEEAKKQIDLRA